MKSNCTNPINRLTIAPLLSMSQVQMNHTKQPNKESKFFLTCNYGGTDPCLDQRCLSDIARLEGFCREEIESGIMDAAMVWEERAPTTGTIHWHGVFILKREKRMRPAQFTQWFVQKLP